MLNCFECSGERTSSKLKVNQFNLNFFFELKLERTGLTEKNYHLDSVQQNFIRISHQLKDDNYVGSLFFFKES